LLSNYNQARALAGKFRVGVEEKSAL